MKFILLGAIRTYQWLLSPWIGNQCLYWPTCSEYARQAIERHGAARGALMGAARLLRCRPGATGGIDPVPPHFSLRCACTDPAHAEFPLTNPGPR